MSENQRRPVRMHGPGARMGGEKAKDFKGTIKKLVKYIGPHLSPYYFLRSEVPCLGSSDPRFPERLRRSCLTDL